MKARGDNKDEGMAGGGEGRQQGRRREAGRRRREARGGRETEREPEYTGCEALRPELGGRPPAVSGISETNEGPPVLIM